MADSKDKKKTMAKTKAASGVLTTNTSPTADALKERFKSGSIPLQSDFADLIDMAEIGRRAVGGAPDLDGPGNGLKINENGILQVDAQTVLPRGIITMFSGSSAPDGWVLCDGTNGTPDLRDRFIKGASGYSGSSGGEKSITYTPAGNVTVSPHKLTIDEIPPHNHSVTGVYDTSSGGWLPYMRLGHTNRKEDVYSSISSTGGGEAHTHTASFKGNSFNIDLEPTYYALAFIMKT